MNNVDLLLRYLAGELNREEAEALESRLESDRLLRKTYNEVSEAYGLVRDQLRKMDEEAFRKRLLQVMEQHEPRKTQRRPGPRIWWAASVALAGCIAAILLVWNRNVEPERLLARYYHPGEDQVIETISDGSRGLAGQGALLFQQGRYAECLREMEDLLIHEPGDRVALLFYLLASMEEGRAESTAARFDSFRMEHRDRVDQALAWYAGLAMIQAGRTEKASDLLGSLAEESGPYRTDALRLLKQVSK